MDADDISLPDRLRTQVGACGETHLHFISCASYCNRHVWYCIYRGSACDQWCYFGFWLVFCFLYLVCVCFCVHVHACVCSQVEYLDAHPEVDVVGSHVEVFGVCGTHVHANDYLQHFCTIFLAIIYP